MANNIFPRFFLPLPLPASSHKFLQTLFHKLLHCLLNLKGRIFFWKVQGPPFESLGLILHYIPDRIDRVRFKSVCKSWHLAESHYPRPSMHPPLLLPSRFLPQKSDVDVSFVGNRLSLVIRGEIVPALGCNFSKNIYWLVGPKGINWAQCYGSTSDGWLFMVQRFFRKEIFLMNFFSREKIVLPPMGPIPWQEIFPAQAARFLNWIKFVPKKAIILSSPQSYVQYCLVAAVNRHGFISLCKPGGNSWTVNLTNDTLVEEIIFYKDKLHGITKQEELYLFNVIDCEKNQPKLGNIVEYNIRTRADLTLDMSAHNKYIIHLCEHNGKLLMVLRYYKLKGFIMKSMKTVRFRVFELDETANTCKWVELKSLRDHVMFLDNQGARLFPKSNFECIKGDCIYFADESLGRCFSFKVIPDMGFYSMSEGCIKPFIASDSLWRLSALWSRSVWLFHPKC